MLEYKKEIKLSKHLICGYMYFLDSHHPLATRSGFVYYHRHIASVKIGRWLTKEEHVHHINGNKLDNSIDNLMIVSRKRHMELHKKKSINICKTCGKETRNDYFCSWECARFARRVVERPTKEELKNDIFAMNFEKISEKYGVSSRTIRKWAKGYGI